jgi:tetratricopeptide (TPR) repeat protein
MGRRLLALLVVALAMANTVAGVRRIIAFSHVYGAERTMARAQGDATLDHLEKAVWWQPGDATPYLLIGQVVLQAQANGLPLRKLEGRQTLEVFGFGLASIAQGIDRNPADAWGWFKVATLYQAIRPATERMEKMLRAGRAVIEGTSPPPAPERPRGLDALDRVSIAAARQAYELEPGYYFHQDFMADLYWRRGMEQEAAGAIRASLALTPALPAHHLMENARFVTDLAVPILEGLDEAARNQYVDKVSYLRARAEVLEKLERYDEASAAYAQMGENGARELRQESDVEVARLMQLRQRFSDSLAPLGRAERLGTDTYWGASAVLYTGVAQAETGDHAAARGTFERYLKLAPDSVVGYELLVRELQALGRPAEAEKIALAAVRRFPRLPHLYESVIALMRAQGKSRDAIPYAAALRKVGDRDRADQLLEELEREAGKSTP